MVFSETRNILASCSFVMWHCFLDSLKDLIKQTMLQSSKVSFGFVVIVLFMCAAFNRLE